jgi:hemolysin III
MSTVLLVRGATSDAGSRAALVVREATLDSVRRSATAAQGRDEELMNSITHGLGLVLSIAGLSALVTLAGNIGTMRSTVGCGVYGASLVMLYAASTLYHSWPAGELKRLFHLLDHIGIYVLIAGTYTPMALFASSGLFGWSCLSAAWSFALFGSCAKVARMSRLDDDSSMPYLVMGVMCVMSAAQLVTNLPSGETTWLLKGGLFYLAGAIFYFNDDKRFYHSIWHLFVLAGSICHYRAVLGHAITATF